MSRQARRAFAREMRRDRIPTIPQAFGCVGCGDPFPIGIPAPYDADVTSPSGLFRVPLHPECAAKWQKDPEGTIAAAIPRIERFVKGEVPFTRPTAQDPPP